MDSELFENNELHELETFYGNIYLGMQKGYNSEYFDDDSLKTVISKICNEKSICVTVTETKFYYVNGGEPGFIIGCINYPRFPMDKELLRTKILSIAKELKKTFEQIRVTVVFPDKTVMIGQMN